MQFVFVFVLLLFAGMGMPQCECYYPIVYEYSCPCSNTTWFRELKPHHEKCPVCMRRMIHQKRS